MSVIDALDAQIAPLDKELRSFARRQAGCKVLMGQFGVGELTAGHTRRRPTVLLLARRGPLRRLVRAPQNVRVRIAGDERRRVRELTRSIDELERELAALVTQLAPRLLAERGGGVLTAAKFDR